MVRQIEQAERARDELATGGSRSGEANADRTNGTNGTNGRR